MSNGIRHQDLSGDPEVGETYERDPLKHDRVSARLGLDILRNGMWVLQNAVALRIPLLLIHGSDDRITSSQASRAFADAAGRNCTLSILQTTSHELHHDPDAKRVFEIILHWLEQMISAEERTI
jgi:alpha-beta hydrolase superfamily lysophospholipase